MDETMTTGKPFFRGTRGPEFEATCQNIEDEFVDYLNSVKLISHKILNVHQVTWHDDLFIFRGKMKDLEIMIENLLNIVFSYNDTIEDGVYALYGFYNYLSRESLKPIFENKTTRVSEEILFLFLTKLKELLFKLFNFLLNEMNEFLVNFY